MGHTSGTELHCHHRVISIWSYFSLKLKTLAITNVLHGSDWDKERTEDTGNINVAIMPISIAALEASEGNQWWMEQVRYSQPARRGLYRGWSFTESQCRSFLFTNCVFNSHNNQVSFGETTSIFSSLSMSSTPATMPTLHIGLLTREFIKEAMVCTHLPYEYFHIPGQLPKFHLCTAPSDHLFNNRPVLFFLQSMSDLPAH